MFAMPSPGPGISHAPPAWLARMWEVGAVVGTAAVVLAAVVLWVGMGSWAATLDQSLQVTGDGLTAISETLGVADDTMDVIVDVSRRLTGAMDRVAETTGSIDEVVESTAVLLGEDLPSDIEAIRQGLDGVIDTANVIDGVLGALSFVGVPYDPQVPMDEALREVDARIGALPDRFRVEADLLSSISGDIDSFGADADAMAGDLGRLEESLDSSARLLTEYQATVDEASAAVGVARTDLARTLIWLRVVTAVGALVGLLALSGLWWLGRSTQSSA